MSPPAVPRLVYIHVMKTGGLALSHWLRRSFDPQRTYPLLGVPHVTNKSDVAALLRHGPKVDEIDFYTVHMPAWVATDVLGDHTAVTVLREPVERTISHLFHIQRLFDDGRSIDELYDDPLLHSRLVNYQTQIFSIGPTDGDLDPPAPPPPDLMDEKFKAGVHAFFATSLQRSAEPTRAELDVARQTLQRFAIVGTTDRLAATVADLAAFLRVPDVGFVSKNVRRRGSAVSPSLRRRIAADNLLDSELYEAVRAGI